jgi:hypothetical protein
VVRDLKHLPKIKNLIMDISALLVKNREEIREDDTRKQQALIQFREWLAKHPFIAKCRQGGVKVTKLV